MRILVTGSAGFIGSALSINLLSNGHEVVGVDNHSDYYDPKLKINRLKNLRQYKKFSFENLDIGNFKSLIKLFEEQRPQKVVHLAAQAGVRHSIVNPQVYLQSNLVGFGNVLELCRKYLVDHLVYASSSSVYGSNINMPYSTRDSVDHPLSLYAATKRANELMAHSYSHLYGLPTTGLRYFTVYGPWGRPDMAPWLFTEAILGGRPINIFNKGDMQRDFTFIDDLVIATATILQHIPTENPKNIRADILPDESNAPFKIYNIGNHEPINLIEFINLLEESLSRKAIKNYLPLQDGDVLATYADISSIQKEIGFKPKFKLADGMCQWVDWYKNYHNIK